MNLVKIAEKTYSFKEAIITGSYQKEDKTFLFTISRTGFNPATSVQKSILTMDRQIETIYNSMTEIPVNNEVDIDADLSDAELALAEFIRKYNPEEEVVITGREIGETQDEVLILVNKFLSSESPEDYAAFRDELNAELSQPEELTIH